MDWLIVLRCVMLGLAVASTWSAATYIRSKKCDSSDRETTWRFVGNGILWAWFAGVMGWLS